jgi:mono/diheme cytochrome c family protein
MSCKVISISRLRKDFESDVKRYGGKHGEEKDRDRKKEPVRPNRRKLRQARLDGWVPLVACLALLGSQSAAMADDGAGPYSEAQAGRGEALYQQYCSACHGARLQGNPAAPLTGEAFRARWEDGKHTLDDLFYIIRSLMPNNAPGSLTKAQYADVVAYILKVNGYPAAGAELVPDAAAMRAVTLLPH